MRFFHTFSQPESELIGDFSPSNDEMMVKKIDSCLWQLEQHQNFRLVCSGIHGRESPYPPCSLFLAQNIFYNFG